MGGGVQQMTFLSFLEFRTNYAVRQEEFEAFKKKKVPSLGNQMFGGEQFLF